MKFFRLKTTDPHYNLAVEEYLFSNSTEEIFILWQNEPTVVIGKNQNLFCEIDHDYLLRNNIKVARRITGGGAVYHDGGNLNYTFIGRARQEGIDFTYFSAPVIAALKKLSIDAELSGRNDILAGGRKISGNAQCNRDGRVLHHGTLLFDSDLEVLSRVLSVDVEKLRSKALKSTRSRVANIRELLPNDMTVEEFISHIEKEVKLAFLPEVMDAPKNAEIDALYNRNRSEEWLYPDKEMLSSYDMILKKRFSIGTVCLNLKLKNEKITSCKITGDFFGAEDLSPIENSFVGYSLKEILHSDFKCDGLDLISGFTMEMVRELVGG